MSTPQVRARALAEALRWEGTPYVHQASTRGAGADCLGVVRGVWRALYGVEPEPVPPYRSDWAEAGGREALLDAARRSLTEIEPADALPGDVLMFRMAPGALVKHAAIRTSLPGPTDRYGRILHAYWGRAAVECHYAPWWSTKLAAAFAFPDRPLIGEAAWDG